MTGPLTPGGGIVGVTNGLDAAPGMVGEVMSVVNTTGTGSLTNAVATNVAAITLTPGDWDVTGEVLLTASGLVITSYHAALNQLWSASRCSAMRR